MEITPSPTTHKVTNSDCAPGRASGRAPLVSVQRPIA